MERCVKYLKTKFWFSTTEAGRDALGYYHERKDEQRYIGLGPEHDWSSHAADAFGLMAISYEPPEASRRFKLNYPPTGLVWPRMRLISAG
jgi:phage terminase large subunit